MIVPGLLVSVRSVDEARAAVEGGASLIDVKEPARGPLGRAEVGVWAAVRAVVPEGISMSVALGELSEWTRGDTPGDGSFAGIAYRKLGLAGGGRIWRDRWKAIRDLAGAGRVWVAVAYSDWQRASAPPPEHVLDEALAVDDCAAVLVDTWDKARPSDLDDTWLPWVTRARQGGLRVALAGGLGESDIERLAVLAPDWFAVRGAACRDGQRRGQIDPDRVAKLVARARRTG